MARIKPGPDITDIRNSIGDETYSIWKAGVHYVKGKSVIVDNPNTVKQRSIRDKVQNCSQRWGNVLTLFQQDKWNEYVQSLHLHANDDGGVRSIIPKNTGRMSGYNAFIMLNVRALPIIGAGSFIDDAPLDRLKPPDPVVGAGLIGPDFIQVNWTTDLSSGLSDHIRIWIRNRQETVHRQMHDTVIVTAGTMIIRIVQTFGGLNSPVFNLPGNYLIQIDRLNDVGLISTPSNTFEIIVP